MARKKKGPESSPLLPGLGPADEPSLAHGGEHPLPKAAARPKKPTPKAGKASPLPAANGGAEAPEPSKKPKEKARAKEKAKAKSVPKKHGIYAPRGPRTPRGKLQRNDRPENRALQLLTQAYRAETQEKTVELAHKAIETWPDCSEAYILLAQSERNPQNALELYTKATEASRRLLGEEFFREGEGDFWMLPETRPYMRARFGLAQKLWAIGRHDDAIGHYLEMLRLNPNDNQGVRYVLASCLLDLGRDQQLGALLMRFKEDGSTHWLYTEAILAFRILGDNAMSRALLKEARKTNKYVPDLLTGRVPLPAAPPRLIGDGDRNEAVDYALNNLSGWRMSPGALAWLRGVLDEEKAAKGKGKGKGKAKAGARGKAKGRSPKAVKAYTGPQPEALERLKDLPHRPEAVWEAEARKIPAWVEEDRGPVRPWVVIVACRDDGLILSQTLLDGAPTPDVVWDQLEAAMNSPSAGPSYRPGAIVVRPSRAWELIKPTLDRLEIELRPEGELGLIDHVLQVMIAEVFGPQGDGPALLDMPLVTPERVSSFYEAAAAFYRDAPWLRITGEETIKVTCDAYESGPWYCVVIGQMGMTLGFALYEDYATLVRMREGDSSDEENARETVALSVTFGDETETDIRDVDAAERNGWEIAGEDAYPAPLRKERGLVMRPPLAWELRLLEACLHAIPAFLRTHERRNVEPFSLEAPTADGPLRLDLSWAN